MLPFDLHVLGLPPAFTLSQDQTLHLKTHSPRTKNLKLQMLDRWQRFACFKTIDMLLDQTSARWTNHPSCRRLHKIPAHTVKELGSRPQRLSPCAPTFPSLRAAHYSWLFRFVNTFFEVFCVSTDRRYLPGGRSRPLVVMPGRPEGLSSLRAAYYVRLFESVNNL